MARDDRREATLKQYEERLGEEVRTACTRIEKRKRQPKQFRPGDFVDYAEVHGFREPLITIH